MHKSQANPYVVISLAIFSVLCIHGAILAFVYSQKMVGRIVRSLSPEADGSVVNHYVAIASCKYPWEAEKIQTILERKGIPFLIHESSSSIPDNLSTGPGVRVKVLVPQEFEEQAIKVLED